MLKGTTAHYGHEGGYLDGIAAGLCDVGDGTLVPGRQQQLVLAERVLVHDTVQVTTSDVATQLWTWRTVRGGHQNVGNIAKIMRKFLSKIF